MSQKLDYSRLADVAPLLNNTPFASNSVERLSGGNTNYVYRLHLRAPYKHHHTLVLKHAKPYFASDHTIPLPLERSGVEAKTLQRIKEILPTESLVSVPTVYHVDDNAHIIIMEDCGLGSRTLKELFMDETVSTEQAGTICSALGEFLASVHKHGSADKKLMHIVSQNVEMKRLSGALTYGRLVDTITGVPDARVGVAILDSPPSLKPADLGTVKSIATDISTAINNANTGFTMGDPWTGNVVVHTGHDDTGALKIHRVFLVDWEVAKPGLQYLDVAQFVAELHLLNSFNFLPADTGKGAIGAFLSAYNAVIPLNEESLQGAAVHIGVHLVCWAPRTVEWKPKERVQEVVKEGVDYLLKGKGGDKTWLKTSAVGNLL